MICRECYEERNFNLRAVVSYGQSIDGSHHDSRYRASACFNDNGVYDGDRIPSLSWNWPKGTWFQTRLRYLRSNGNDVMEITVRQFE